MAENPAAAAAAEERSARCSAPEPRAVVAPCLVQVYYQEGKRYHAFYNICGPNNETCRGFMPELIGTDIYQKPSHQGWLIVVCEDDPDDLATHGLYETPPGCSYGDCFLWNPMTNETIMLPAILEFYKRGYAFLDCVLSSPPRTTANMNHADDNNSDDSMVLFLFRHEEQYTFVFCRPRETQWRIHEVSPDIADLILERIFGSLLCFKGKLYVMCMDYEPQDNPLDHHIEIEHLTNGTDLTIRIKPFHVKREVCLFPLVGGKTYPDSHYMESHDELFRVDIIKCNSTFEILSIEVVRLNFSLMEWEKVDSLGDHVLFIGAQTTACCSAAQLGFTSGCLYYLPQRGRILHKFLIESTGNTIIFPCLWPTENFLCLDWVIMPINVQQGRVENMLGSNNEENGILMDQETKTSTSTVVSDENQGEECNAEVVEVASYWDNLNEDIVGLIANLLHGSDYKHFRLVSKANRAIIPKVQATSFLSPWMVYSRDHHLTIFSVVNPVYNNENYFMNLSELSGSTIRFQKGGWLLMTRKHNIFFYNPFTRETVKLPDMDRRYCYSIVSFSSSPTSSDCIVFVVDERHHQVYIDFIRRGEAHWNSLFFDNDKYMPFLGIAAFHKGAFFCADYNGTLGVFGVKDSSWKVLEKPHEQYYFGNHFPYFLVECGGDLLLGKLEYHKALVRIFRLNFSEMEWVKVENLGEHTLFVSHTSCVSVVAPNSYMKNRIYFPRLYLKDEGIVFYSLETGCYHSLGSHHSSNNLYDTEGWFRNCTWIEPNRSISTTEELDWLNTLS